MMLQPAAARGAAFGLGAVAATGQAPWGFWWLALPALAALLRLIAAAPAARQRALLGWFGGLGHFGLALSWIVQPFLIVPEVHGWMAPFAVLAMAGGLALFWAAAATAAGLARGPAGRAMAAALALAAAEMLRGVVLTGFPWAQPGHVWAGTPAGQLAAVIGASGLTALTLAAAAAASAGRWRGPAAVLAGLALAWTWGLARPEAAAQAGPRPVIRIVQPNAAQHLKWQPGEARAFFDRLVALSVAPPAAPGTAPPALTVWPETAVPYLLEGSEAMRRAIGAAGRGGPVAAGIQRSDGGVRGWNSLAVIAPDGQVAAVYDKHHLVPFGEYIPFGDVAWQVFGIGAFAAQLGRGYTAGPGPALLDLGPGLGRALPLICYEAVFPGLLRRAPGRADWIVQITNDAWFGTMTGPYQHLAQARLRAIEQGLPLVRAANTGVSALIDPWGRVVAALPLGQAGFLDVALPPPLPATPYARWGDLPVLLWLGCGALWLAVGRRLDARRRPA
jgi:apolipoprotein N-acyltransferase